MKMSDRPMTKLNSTFDRSHSAAVRTMTADEAQMARALSCSKLPLGRHKATIRLLHAESLKADRHISEHDAALLRSHVIVFKTRLPENIVKMAEPK